MNAKLLTLASVLAATCSPPAFADCAQVPSYTELTAQLNAVLRGGGTKPNGGFGFPMWLTAVDETGVVCAVTNSTNMSQNEFSDIWVGSRVISAQKANTATSFSNGSLSLSTANLYSPVQPGGSLFGLQESNPVDTSVAYKGPASAWGTANDPMVGFHVGGINVFGGGLTLYRANRKIGAIGVSGDTSCTDHVVAWKVRAALHLDQVPSNPPFDAMIQDIVPPAGSPSGFGHPKCPNNPNTQQAAGSIVSH
jgi:uncharacterized protein GlcG (DUF336 family)